MPQHYRKDFEQVEIPSESINLNSSSHKYDWLKADVDDDVWDFYDNLSGSYKSRLKVSWAPTVEPKLLVLQKNWVNWTQIVKSICIYLFEKKYVISAPASLKNKVLLIKSIAQYMCFTRRRLSFAEIQKNDIDAYEEYLKSLYYSRSHIEALLSTLKELWGVPCGLRFNPYPPSSNFRNKIRAIGLPDGHRPTLSPKDGLKILNSCLELVLNSDQDLCDYESYLKIKSERKSLNPKDKRSPAIFKEIFGYGVELLNNKIRTIYGAAIIVTLSLTALRKHEISEIRISDALSLLSGERDILTGIERKTARVKAGKETRRETIPELVKAIEVLVRLTKESRDTYKSEKLLLKLPMYNCVNKKSIGIPELGTSSLYSLLNLICKHVGYQKGNLRCHMFRRFYSMMYVWRFEVGDLHSLSKMLFHNSLHFTKAYTEDESVFEFLPEELQKLTHSVFEDALLHEKAVTGRFSKVFERYKKLIQVNVNLSKPENASDLIHSIIERNDYEVIAVHDGYCFINKKRVRYAKCSTNGITPDYSNRSENVCSGCPNFGVTEAKYESWKLREKGHKSVAESTSLRIKDIKGKTNITRNDKKLIKKLNELHTESLKGLSLARKMLNQE